MSANSEKDASLGAKSKAAPLPRGRKAGYTLEDVEDCKRLGLSREDAAKKLGVTPRAISSFLRNKGTTYTELCGGVRGCGIRKYGLEGIRRMREQGMSVGQIAKVCEVRESSVTAYLQRRGHILSDFDVEGAEVRKGRNAGYTLDDIKQRRARGLKLREAAEEIGVGPNSIQSFLRTRGLNYFDLEGPVKRKNPSGQWFATGKLVNDENGFLINPDTDDIYWFHGNRQGAGLSVPRDSETIYLSSMPSTAAGFACGGSSTRDFDVPLYQVKVRISAERVFDVRRAVRDPDFRSFACEMLDLRGDAALTSIQQALSLLHFEEYDYGFNEYPLRGRLVDAGYVAWLETEFVVDATTTEEDLTLALLQEEALEDCIVDDVLYLSVKDCRAARSADRRARSVSELKQKLDI